MEEGSSHIESLFQEWLLCPSAGTIPDSRCLTAAKCLMQARSTFPGKKDEFGLELKGTKPPGSPRCHILAATTLAAPAAIPRSPPGSGHSKGTYQEPEVAHKEQHVPGLQLPACPGAAGTTPPAMPGRVLMQCPLSGWVTVWLRLDGDCGRVRS